MMQTKDIIQPGLCARNYVYTETFTTNIHSCSARINNTQTHNYKQNLYTRHDFPRPGDWMTAVLLFGFSTLEHPMLTKPAKLKHCWEMSNKTQ